MQLGHDHTLGTVDDERTGIGHQRHFAHIHFLLFNFFDRGLGGFFVQDGQTHASPQGRGVSQAALLTFFNVKRRHTQGIADKIQARIFVMALDREYAIECGLQARIIALIGRGISLQEVGKGFQLGRQQEWNRQRTDSLGKTLTNTFFFGKRVAHIISTIKENKVSSHTEPSGQAATKRQGTRSAFNLPGR